ncbi:FAD-dependent thymidylate synthase [compost metagenome]
MTITAKIIAHSIAPNGQMIITWELEYPRFIHGEFMTHRLFSRNAASSRAIPVSAIIEQVKNNPAMPIHWGKNQSGMQASKELSPIMQISAKWAWTQAAKVAAYWAEVMRKIGLHKQATNRVLEPFQTMKTVMTATCMENFFWLRNHEDAQPEIKELARLMWEALQASTPNKLEPGDWHVPYYAHGKWDDRGGGVDKFCVTLQDALAISASCCAQVSYRKLDDTLENAQMVYERLVGSEPVHASPFEHQATPLKYPVISPHALFVQRGWAEGVTHVDRDGNFWSGNFIGWIQHRQLIPNNVKQEVQNG